MARGFSLFFLLLCCAAAWPQTFGRFGYAPCNRVPGWNISSTGFKAESATADTFLFPSGTTGWKPETTSSASQTVNLGDPPAGGPSQLKMDLSVPGFSVYFPNGIDLKLASTGSPFLSWPDGSVGQTVPTPAGPWVLVSFRTDQPPVLLSFVDARTSMEIEGASGEWHLKSEENFKGWVRFLLPLGETGADPVTAASLGELTKAVVENQNLWSGPSPALLDTHFSSDATGITVTWTFDKAGALVPGAALLAGYGGDSLQIESEIMQLEGSTEDGPIAVTREPKLSIRFPLRSWPACRYVAFGGDALSSTPGAADVTSTVEVAIKDLSCSADSKLLGNSGSALMTYLASAHGAVEPYSGLRLPYSADGSGYDLAAAHALLTQALSASNGTPALSNPLLSEVVARVDMYTWRPWNMRDDVWRRASALSAIALAMRPEEDERLLGAELQAGLSAERGLDLWRHWKGSVVKLPPRLEAMESLRKSLFVLKGVSTPDPLVNMLFSPVRSCGLIPLSCSKQKDRTMLSWMSLDAGAGSLVFSSSEALKFGATQNLSSFKVQHQGAKWEVDFKPKAAGACGLELILPSGGAAIPPVFVPQYVESSH